LPAFLNYATRKDFEVEMYEMAVDEPVWPIVHFSNGIERVIRAECEINELGDEKPYSLLCRTQLPLMPVWELSIHKTQVITLEKVKIDVSKAFAPGQVYVALSRATSLDGLQVLGEVRRLLENIDVDDEARSFYKQRSGR
jgi:ATP-dependent DNA helicase PIF1